MKNKIKNELLKLNIKLTGIEYKKTSYDLISESIIINLNIIFEGYETVLNYYFISENGELCDACDYFNKYDDRMLEEITCDGVLFNLILKLAKKIAII